ncbi:MAG: unnamed protein product [uncultured Caballeronia sp.]|nr:MAG: unnamed protein product [uncultured Caballeronia sp.]
MLKDIERLIKRPIPQEIIAGFEPDLMQKPEPILRRSQGGGGDGNGAVGGLRFALAETGRSENRWQWLRAQTRRLTTGRRCAAGRQAAQ